MTSKVQNIQYQLDEWSKEYGLDPKDTIFVGYKDLGGTTMGLCRQFPYEHLYCEIYLDDRWIPKKLGWLEESVLWHEFCHANAFLEDGISDAHNKHFKKYLRRKPKYWIGDIIANIVAPFL